MFKKWRCLCFLFACCLTCEPLKYFVHHLFCVYDELLNFNMEITKYVYVGYVIPNALIFGTCVDEFHCCDINFNPTSIWKTFAEHLSCNSVTHEVFITIIHKIGKIVTSALAVERSAGHKSIIWRWLHIYFCKIHRKEIFVNMLIKCMKYIVRHIYATLVVQALGIQATGSPFYFCWK